ncbi:sensor histidine kinase [Flavivirga jejuensis]|uniref:Histidine kinase n=1 Tax=Flavivirga jejuensis TaxID=870487 RepID=A0ABT8WQL7_9FLAO|nr:histidine kinase [Flavivirga jejuensis]MDO5975455.1 histidine kinase [Flavivirga jejuensis]
MKKTAFFLFFLLIGSKCFAQETGRTPIKYWEEIVEINSYKHDKLKRWNSDIEIELEGNYTIQDSLQVAKVIAKLDSLTETISVRFSKKEKTNLKILFLDTIRYSKGNFNDRITGGSSANLKGVFESELYFYNTDRTNSKFHSTIESRIAKELVGGLFEFELASKGKRESIFNPHRLLNNEESPLNMGDITIIKEVYSSGFEFRLEEAKEQYEYVFDEIENKKILKRSKSIWWVKNPNAILIVPGLILLLAFIMLLKRINQFIGGVIKNDWFKFIIILVVGLIFAWVLLVLYFFFLNFLTTPIEYRTATFHIDRDVAPALIIAFPFIICLRFIELKITKRAHNVAVKTGLIFLSTGFIPFLIVMVIAYFTGNLESSEYEIVLSQFFIGLMGVASFRALISFFVFKERNLVIENDMKLSKLRELKTKAELRSLQAQINPHFLYNALNSIASLAHTNADKTEKMALALSDLFKYTINRKGKKRSTINDEVIMVRSYLEIEETRFGDRLEFAINVDSIILNEEIPMFILQPLVENAVKHGISKIEEKGKIILNILKTERGIDIEVLDNGPDFPEGLVSGHGLQSVYDLLRLSYGDKASLKWQNTPGKRIIISIDKTI